MRRKDSFRFYSCKAFLEFVVNVFRQIPPQIELKNKIQMFIYAQTLMAEFPIVRYTDFIIGLLGILHNLRIVGSYILVV